jgi:hypothetical protein
MRILEDTRCVYVILNLETSRVKIGVSNNVSKRVESLKSSSGCELKVIYHTFFLENPFGLEMKLHKLLKDYRYLGEWFTIDHERAVKLVQKLEKEHKLCEVCKMFNKPLNPTNIALELGVSRNCVVRHLSVRGFKIKEKKIKKIPLDKNGIPKPIRIVKMKPVIIPVTALNIGNMVSKNNEKLKLRKALDAQRLNLKIDLHAQY